MRDISLKDLLEAGCHFGHKVNRWHPKATSFIYQSREGVHIIDLVKTRDWLKKAADYICELGKKGKTVLFVASKRQAKGVVTESSKRAGVPYMTNRWVGGFLTNWDEVKKNIDKMNTWRKEKVDGTWDKYPKHEVVKLNKLLRKVEQVYVGVGDLTQLPDAVFMIDINKEITALQEATRREIPILALVDTNSNPTLVDFPIPANDDAVGSISYIVNYITDAYMEGKSRKMRDSAEAEKLGEKKEVKSNTKETINKKQDSSNKRQEAKQNKKTSKIKKSAKGRSASG